MKRHYTKVVLPQSIVEVRICTCGATLLQKERTAEKIAVADM
jgi:hypothetical protein